MESQADSLGDNLGTKLSGSLAVTSALPPSIWMLATSTPNDAPCRTSALWTRKLFNIRFCRISVVAITGCCISYICILDIYPKKITKRYGPLLHREPFG